MANNGDLSLVISKIVIDEKTALPDINAAIQKLSKKIKPLELKLNIDTATLDKFIASVEKMKKISDEQNKIVSETQDVYRKLDGSITTVTQRVQKNGEVIQKTKTVHDENKKAMQNESVAADKLAQNIEKLNKAELDSIQINRNKNGAPTGYTIKSSQGYEVKTQRLESDGETLVNSKAVINYKRQREDTLKDIERIDRDHFHALKDNNARIEATDRQHYLALQQNAKRNLDFRQAVADRQAKLDDLMNRVKSNKVARESLNELNNSLSSVKNIGDYSRGLKDIDIGLKNVAATAKNSAGHMISFKDAMSTAFQKFPIWMLATTAFYAPLRAIQSGVTYIANLDAAMTDLQKVTDETQSSYSNFAKSAAVTANEIGALTLSVIQSTTEWARLGYTLQQSAMLAKQTAIYQNVGDIKNAEQASTDLISAIKGFNIEIDANGKNIEHLIDVYNEVGNRYSISSAGIGEAAKRSASALHEAGNTMEQSVALITGANASVQDTSKVGNALKSISLRLRGISEDGNDVSDLVPTLEKKFNSMGLSLKKDENTFKSTYEIFSDIHNVIDSLNGMQRSDLLELVAGKENANVAASLIANWKDAEGALQAGVNSLGSAARENSKYLDSLQGHVAKFTNSVNYFWSSSMNSEFLKQIVDLGTLLVNSLDSVGNTVLLLSGIFLAFKGKALANFITGTYASIKGLLTFNQTIAATTVATEGAAVAMTAFQRALGIIGLIVTAGSLVYSVFQGINAASENMSSSIEKINQNYDQLNGTIQDTLSYYQENNTAISSNTEVKSKLFELQNKLIDSFGAEAKGIDLVNGKYQDQVDILKNISISALDKKIKESKLAIDSANDKGFGDPFADVNHTFAKDYLGMGDQDFKIIQDRTFGKTNDIQTYYNKLQKLYDDILNENDNVIASLGAIPKNATEWSNALRAVKNEIDRIKPTYDEIANVQDNINSKVKLQNSLTDDQLTAFDKISGALRGNVGLKDYESVINNVLQAVSSSDGKNLFTIIDKIKEIPQINSNAGIVKNLDDIISSLGKATTESIDFSGIYNKLSTAFEEAVKPLKELNQALQDVSKGQSLSAETVASLIEQYPELAGHIKKTADGWTIEKGAIESVRNAQIKLKVDTLNSQLSMSNATYAALAARLTMYDIEIDKIQNLQDAMNAANKLNSSNLPSGVPAYLRNTGNTLTDKIEKDVVDLGKAKDELNALTDLLKDPNLGTSGDGKKSKDQTSKLDATEAFINATNRQAIAQEGLNAKIKDRLALAKDEKNNQTIAKETTNLIKGQQTEVANLESANKKLEAKIAGIYKTNPEAKKFFDQNGNLTEAYYKTVNGLKTKSAQDAAQALADKLGKLKKATKDNSEAIVGLKKDLITESNDLKNIAEQMASDLINAEKKVEQTKLDNHEKEMNRLNNEAKTRIDGYQNDIDALEKKNDIEDASYERSKRLNELSSLSQQAAIFQSNTIASISDELAKQLGLEDAKREAMQKQNDILKQREVIQNIQNEKNVRLLKDGKFEWVADPRKIRDEQQKLVDMEKDLSDWRLSKLDDLQNSLKDKTDEYRLWELDQTRKHEKALLQEKIKAEQDKIDEREKTFNEEKLAFDDHYANMDILAQTALDKLKGTYGTKWDEIISVLAGKLATAKQMYDSMTSMASVPTPTVSTPSGGGGGNSTPSSGSSKSNQQVYLENLQKTGTKGEKQWAGEQLKAKKYADGGLNTETGPAWLDGTPSKPELVLKPDDTKNFLDALKITEKLKLPEILSQLKTANFLPNFQVKMQDFSSIVKQNSSGTGDEGDTYNIHVDRVVTPNARDFIKNLKMQGKNRTN